MYKFLLIFPYTINKLYQKCKITSLNKQNEQFSTGKWVAIGTHLTLKVFDTDTKNNNDYSIEMLILSLIYCCIITNMSVNIKFIYICHWRKNT